MATKAKSKSVKSDKPKKSTPKQKKESLKQTIEGFRGGLEIALDVTLSDGKSLREKLSAHIGAVLDQEMKNQEGRIDKVRLWEKQYRGWREEKTFPFTDCANVAVPITRSNADAIHVRLVDAIFNKRKVWIVKARKKEFVGIDRELEEALDWFQKNKLDFEHVMMSPLLQCIKTGTGMVKVGWATEKRTTYRYATQDEMDDKNEKKYALHGTTAKAVKNVITTYAGPKLYPIAREDFIISSDATNLQNAYLTGFRTYLRLEQIELKAKQGLYDPDSVDRLKSPDEIDDVKHGRVISQEKEIRPLEELKPYQVWELWLKYDVDDDGEADDIVITFHKETGEILRAIYNPMFLGFRPFVSMVFYPHEYSFDGEGVCEILEKVQKEIDSLHNQRLDRLTQINAPILFVRAGSNLEDLEELEPGKIYTVDDELESAIREFRFSDTTFSTHQEEDRLIAMADRAVGISPNVLGISSAERPVAKETFANIEEANKKFKFGIDNLRRGVSEIGYMLLEFFAQYQPTYEYQTQTGEQFTERVVNFPLDYIRDGLAVDLATSTELINQEVRREIHLILYQLLSDYYTKTAGMVQAIMSPETPSQFKIFLISIIEKGDKRLESIMRDFEERDPEAYTVNITKVIDVEKAIQQSVDLMPPPEEGPPAGQQPGGGPIPPPEEQNVPIS